MRFHDPLWLLMLLPLLAVFFWRVRHRYAVLYSDVRSLAGLPVTWAQRVKRALPWVQCLALALVVVALARPQRGREEFRVRTEGIAIQLVLDRSGSMRAEDFEDEGRRVNRLHVVKRVADDFAAGRRDDLLGLVVFGGFAESVCPLTLDHDAFRAVLADVEIPQPLVDARGRILDEEGYREEMATAIGDALAVASARLKEARAKSKVIILVSDGESNAGVVQPPEATDAAAALGIRVYTIGVGSTGVAPIPVEDRFGRKRYSRQMVRLDEDALRAIAQKTGGKYFNARDTASLEKVYEEIDELEKTETEGVLYTDYRELYALALLPGLGLLLLVLCGYATRFLTLP